MTKPLPVQLESDVLAGLAGVDERGSDGVLAGAAPESLVARRPRAHARTTEPAPVVVPAVEIGPLSGRPTGATHWAIKRRNAHGEMVQLVWGPPGSAVEAREWPITDLDLTFSAIYDRWGDAGGFFELIWVVPTANGNRRYHRPTKALDLKPRERAHEAAPVAASPVRSLLDGPVGDAFQMIKQIEGMTSSKVGEMMQLAAAFATMSGARSGGGLSSEDLRAILREEREAHTVALAASEARTAAAIASLREDDDDEGGGVATEAAGALGSLITGKGKWSQVARFVTANPGLAEKALPIVHELGGQLLSVLKAFASPPQAAAARAVAVPRMAAPMPVQHVEPLGASSPPIVSSGGSLSDLAPRPVSNGVRVSSESRSDAPLPGTAVHG